MAAARTRISPDYPCSSTPANLSASVALEEEVNGDRIPVAQGPHRGGGVLELDPVPAGPRTDGDEEDHLVAGIDVPSIRRW